METFGNLPFVKLVFPFVAGIISAFIWALPPHIAAISLGLFASIFLLPFIFPRNLRLNTIANFSVLLLFFFLGWFVSGQSLKAQNEKVSQALSNEGLFLLKCVEPAQEKLPSLKIEAILLKAIYSSHKVMVKEGGIVIYLKKETVVPKVGELFFIKGKLLELEEPENPRQFNYKAYLNQNGIFYQTFISQQNHIFNTGVYQLSFIDRFIVNFQFFLRDLFRDNIQEKRALGVTEALLFGYKNDVSKELKSSYSRTGTMHILAVSGLHVAIVFLIFAKLLGFLKFGKYQVLLKTVLILLFIWGYCLITGMVPSIIRAGLMISLVIIGKAINRHAPVLNAMSFAAFIILLINPLWILNIGFQLSFMAVTGIVLIPPHIEQKFNPKARLLKPVWQLLVVTVSAQVATFPLTIFYFNQFPNYFILSNLILIPLTTLVLYSGIAMIFCCKIPLLLGLFASLTEGLVSFSNWIVTAIDALPNSVTEGLKLSAIQVLLLYFMIIGVMILLKWKSKLSLFVTLLCATFFTGLRFFDIAEKRREKCIQFFKVPYQNVILISNGSSSVVLYDSSKNTTSSLMFYIQGWLIEHRQGQVKAFFELEKIKTARLVIPEMNLFIAEGMLFFYGKILNFIPENVVNSKISKHFFTPSQLRMVSKLEFLARDTVYLGYEKGLYLHKKDHNYGPNYQNCVIKNIPVVGYTKLIIK